MAVFAPYVPRYADKRSGTHPGGVLIHLRRTSTTIHLSVRRAEAGRDLSPNDGARPLAESFMRSAPLGRALIISRRTWSSRMRTVSLTSQAARTTSGHLTELSRGHGAKEGLAKTPQPRRGPHARTHTRCSRKTPSGKVHQETVREEKPGRWGSTPRHEVGAPLGRAPPLGRVLVITQSSRALIHQSGGWALNPPRRALTPLGRALHPSAELRHPSAESCTPRQRSAPLGRDLIHQSPQGEPSIIAIQTERVQTLEDGT